jgi:hypothetical protein
MGFGRADTVRLDAFLGAINAGEELGPLNRDIMLRHMYAPGVLDSLAAFSIEEQAACTVHRDEASQFVLLHFRMGVTDFSSFFEEHALLQLCLHCELYDVSKRVLGEGFVVQDAFLIASRQRRRSNESRLGPRIMELAMRAQTIPRTPQAHSMKFKRNKSVTASIMGSPRARHSLIASSLGGKALRENDDIFSDIRHEADDRPDDLQHVDRLDDPVGYLDSVFRDSQTHAERQTYNYHNDYVKSRARVSRTHVGNELSRTNRVAITSTFNAQEPIRSIPLKKGRGRQKSTESNGLLLKSQTHYEQFPEVSPYHSHANSLANSRANSPRMGIDNIMARRKPPPKILFETSYGQQDEASKMPSDLPNDQIYETDFSYMDVKSPKDNLIPFGHGFTPKHNMQHLTPAISRANSIVVPARESFVSQDVPPLRAMITRSNSMAFGSQEPDRRSEEIITNPAKVVLSPPSAKIKSRPAITITCAEQSLDPDTDMAVTDLLQSMMKLHDS